MSLYHYKYIYIYTHNMTTVCTSFDWCLVDFPVYSILRVKPSMDRCYWEHLNRTRVCVSFWWPVSGGFLETFPSSNLKNPESLQKPPWNLEEIHLNHSQPLDRQKLGLGVVLLISLIEFEIVLRAHSRTTCIVNDPAPHQWVHEAAVPCDFHRFPMSFVP